MKTLTALLVTTACALTITSNSFGMLTKASSLKHIKKIRSFHTNSPMYNGNTYFEAKDINNKAQKILDKANANNELLNKIIQQNEQNNNLLKENNALLRIIPQYSYLLSKSKRNNQNYHYKEDADRMDSFHKLLEKQYNIYIETNE